MASFIRPKKNRSANISFECEGVDLLPGESIVCGYRGICSTDGYIIIICCCLFIALQCLLLCSVGEIIVARAKNAHLILTFHEKMSLAIRGILVSTNYRVTFVPDKEVIAKVPFP